MAAGAAALAVWLLGAAPVVRAESPDLPLPPLAAPEAYGDVTIDRMAKVSGMPGVSFSHWSHRLRHTCRVCHFELEFEMRANATEITHENNDKGKFCGACHDGKTAFAHRDDKCEKCHRDVKAPDAAARERFSALTGRLPSAPFGNKVDWSAAIVRRMIRPSTSIQNTASRVIDQTVEMKPEWQIVPPVRFPHAPHTEWLDCANCHPGLFAIKKTVTKHVNMTAIIEGTSCGVCHLRVAFPLNDCKRCHPAWVD